jgi:hypothetical protein
MFDDQEEKKKKSRRESKKKVNNPPRSLSPKAPPHMTFMVATQNRFHLPLIKRARVGRVFLLDSRYHFQERSFKDNSMNK